jgi:hypothetical protein
MKVLRNVLYIGLKIYKNDNNLEKKMEKKLEKNKIKKLLL